VITVDADGLITSFREKIEIRSSGEPLYISTGAYCFDKGIFDLMPESDVFSIEQDFFPTIAGKKCYGFEIKEEFLDIGVPERFQKALVKFKKEKK